MPQAGFDPPKQIAAQVLKLSRCSTSKPPRLDFRKFVHTNLPQGGFELGSLGRPVMLPTEPTLLVVKFNLKVLI